MIHYAGLFHIGFLYARICPIYFSNFVGFYNLVVHVDNRWHCPAHDTNLQVGRSHDLFILAVRSIPTDGRDEDETCGSEIGPRFSIYFEYSNNNDDLLRSTLSEAKSARCTILCTVRPSTRNVIVKNREGIVSEHHKGAVEL